MTDHRHSGDPFLHRHSDSDLRIASEVLSNWIPFISRDLCDHCTSTLSRRIQYLSSQVDGIEKEPLKSGSKVVMPYIEHKDVDNCDTHSLGSWKDEGEVNSRDTNGWSKSPIVDASPREVIIGSMPVRIETPRVCMSLSDMSQEDELEEDGENEESKLHENGELRGVTREKTELSRDQREYLRFMNVQRKKDFVCHERVEGKVMNVLQGLELHSGVFSALEQKRIVDCIYDLAEKGKKGELKERTYTAPRKWMKGKGRITIQFGCCYNYALDKNGNPPGILKYEEVDPMPPLFKVIIKRLIRWHVLPPSCVPDSCIVNIYEEGDCIPPHIDNHDFVRPFCTISFLSECNILFGTDLKIEGPGEFSGAIAIPLPIGSVLVINGNGADVAKHCVPAVPSKRISITFRRMDELKRPASYVPDPDLLGLRPLRYNYDEEGEKKFSTPRSMGPMVRQRSSGGFRSERKRYEEPRYSARNWVPRRGPRIRVYLG